MIVSGLDLGQSKDFTALACLDRQPAPAGSGRRRFRYDVVWLQAWELGTKYTDIAAGVKALYDRPQLARTRLATDFGGVGRPVYDQLKAVRVQARIVPVLLTAGKLVHKDEKSGSWNVPKRDLVAVLQVLLQANLLRWSTKLPLAPRLERELADFRVTITKARNETFGAEASQHDDLVLAVMLAAWLGEHDGGGDVAGIGVPAEGKANVVEGAPRGAFIEPAGVGDDPRHFGGRP